MAAAIAAVIDDEVVRRIDAIDNGIGEPDGLLGLAAFVDDFNGTWDYGHLGDTAFEDAAFIQAAEMVQGVLQRRIERVRARLAADAAIVAAYA